jgi:hypothetical protein
MRKNNLVLFLLLLSTAIFCQSKNLSNFTSISTSGSVQVELIKSDKNRAEYSISKGNKEDLYIEVKGSELEVKIKSNYKFWNRSETKASVTIYYTSLSGIDCSAGSKITAKSEINTSSMEIETSSGSSCMIILKSENLKVRSSSGSKVSITGDVKQASYEASSGARIDANHLESKIADADVSSGGSITMHVSKKLTAEASSGGSIKYRGNPESTDIDSGMSGSIKSF